jgi:hypothetical protein
MSGFIRRYGYFPSQQVINQIEGVVIVDTPPPNTIQGVNTGVVGIVGEFADASYASLVNGSGEVTAKIQPVEVFTAQDLINKVGGFDATLGDFGAAEGNGYIAVDGKRFSRLIVAPVFNVCSKAVRVYRELPLSQSDTNAVASPDLQPATVVAGTQFTKTTDTMLLASRFSFTADAPLAAASDGQFDGGTTVTHTFTSASAHFIAAGVKIGDALVVGYGAVGADNGTFRITAVYDTQLTVEKLDGSAWLPVGTASSVYRVHPAATFDTGGENALSVVGACDKLVRLISAGPVAANSACLATAASGLSPVANGVWSPTSGLSLYTGAGALAYVAGTMAPNAANNTTMDTAYKLAIDAFLADLDPVRDTSVIVSARSSDSIRSYLRQHVITSSAQGRGRMTIISPELTTVSQDTVVSGTTPGVGAYRDERVIYSWPGVQYSSTAAAGHSIKLANGTSTISGVIDNKADVWLASVLSNLAAEKNPGQAASPVPEVLAPILGYQSGNLPAFSMANYINLKQYGVCAIRFDRGGVKVFQSGVTTSLVAGTKNINRRRMADEIEDSLAEAWNPLSKQVLTNQLKDAIDTQTVAYMNGLLSPTNPAAQRIAAYSIDNKSGNTFQLNAAGIYVVIVRVQMLNTADTIVLQAEIGPNVQISTT